MAATTVPVLRRPSATTARRFPLRLAAAVAAVGVAGGGAYLVTRPAGHPATGGPAPAFQLADVRGTASTVSLPGGQPAVVNFFAAWCVPCRAELPVLQAASQRAAGVAFVGVDVNDSKRAAAELLADAGVTFPAGYDPDQAVATSYQVRGMPTTVFVDAVGRIEAVHQGEITAAELDRRLAGLGVGAR